MRKPDLIISRRRGSFSPKSGVRTIYIDEVNDLGTGDKWFLTVASSTDEPFEFGYVIGKRFRTSEMKFRNNRKKAYSIIRELDPLLDRVYYVAVHKDEPRIPAEEQHNINANSLYELALMILDAEDADYLEVYLDHTTQYDPNVAQNIFDSLGDGRSIVTSMRHSRNDVALQSHDFIAGAEGRDRQYGDTSYSELIHAETRRKSYANTDEIRNARLQISTVENQEDARGHSKDSVPEYKKTVTGRRVASPKSRRSRREPLKWKRIDRERYECGSLKITKSRMGSWILFQNGRKRKEFRTVAEAKAYAEESLR